jgi:hypothetical protein
MKENIMKLSKETLGLIKNYASINNNLLFKPGNTLSTIAVSNTIMSSCTVAETFPNEFGIYDVNEFLAVLSLFEDPDLEFSEKTVSIKQGNSSIKYFAAAPNSIVVPKKEIIFPEAEINFKLEASVLAMILKTAPILKSTDVALLGDGSTINVVVGDKKNATSNAYTYTLGTTTSTFKVNLKIENLKMVPGDYDVSISSKKISRFKGATNDLVYFVALEADSTFEA